MSKSYYKEIRKGIKQIEKINGKPPEVIRMTQEAYDYLKKEIEEKWPMIHVPKYGRETIFGIPIHIVDKQED